MAEPSSKRATKLDPTFSKYQENEKANNAASKAIHSKSDFPTTKFVIASSIMLIGMVLAYVTAYFAPLNPTPFDQRFDLFSPTSWIQAIEEKGIYRITLLNSTSPITEYATVGEQLALKFANGQAQVIMPQGVTSSFTNNGEQLTVSQNITFENDTTVISGAASESIDQLISSIGENNQIVAVTLSGYVGASITVDEPVKTEKTRSKDVKQQTFQAPPSDLVLTPTRLRLSSEYALATGERLAASIGNYLQNTYGMSNISRVSYGIERHFANTWQDGGGPNSGVLIEISYVVNQITWQSLPENQERVTIAVSADTTASTNKAWEVLNGNVFSFVDEKGERKNVAALVSAFVAVDADLKDSLTNLGTIPANIILPSPQIYPSILSLIILTVFGFFSIRTLRVTHDEAELSVIKEQQIIDNFISDAPAYDKSQDKLGFVEISTALSSFLRNVGTKAPLTLAITGVWGSGKSSLMYFLKQNLESYRLRPVWINAWHHQNEAQFLAGLLNSVQASAIPEFWTSAGLLYRWNLFKMRWSESPFMYVVASLFFFGSLSYWLTLQDVNLGLGNQDVNKDKWQNITAIVTTLIGGVPLVLASMDKISTMLSSSNPIRLFLGSASKGLDLRSNVGLRDKFAKEFKMLCKALGDSTLTIFIDDLDRCKESRIMDVMETLNYLVCSGDCYIILGMEREPVEKAVINYYRNTHEDLSPQELQTKATRYLEKIINIEIPVPTASSTQVSSLVSSNELLNHKTKSRWNWVAPVLFLTALVGSIILGTYLSGVSTFKTSSLEQNSSELNEINSSLKNPPVRDQGPSDLTESGGIVWSINKSAPQRNYLYFILPFLLIGVVALIIRVERYRQRKRIVEEDSAPFLKAIAVWAQALGTTKHTPRSIKRYVNRARYLAMRNLASGAGIKEENLVTLAALLEFVEQNSVEDIAELKQKVPSFDDESFGQDIKNLLAKSEHITEQRLGLFMHWIKGIRVNVT